MLKSMSVQAEGEGGIVTRIPKAKFSIESTRHVVPTVEKLGLL